MSEKFTPPERDPEKLLQKIKDYLEYRTGDPSLMGCAERLIQLISYPRTHSERHESALRWVQELEAVKYKLSKDHPEREVIVAEVRVLRAFIAGVNTGLRQAEEAAKKAKEPPLPPEIPGSPYA